ncbi:TVP38/TMEM64 family protein [Alicyclobacillus herbarius]|uniref:TVP38/TMEM64 family protein n=1 Tax=Alicyclobacillus herbarius TaxID=122960 RepID=UPI0006877328|nr:VTT domain-containing protein [Alicyclobacillus herbarius]
MFLGRCPITTGKAASTDEGGNTQARVDGTRCSEGWTNHIDREVNGQPPQRNAASSAHARGKQRIVGVREIVATAFLFLAGIACVVAFFHYDQSDRLSRLIIAAGPLASVIGIILMTIFCIIPVPSEFLIIILMKIFGPWLGSLYSWTGSMLGAMTTFWLARRYGGKMLRRFITEERFQQVNQWIGRGGPLGLLLARIVPLPFIVVNYTAGVMKSVRTWDYFWTSAVGGIPYYVGAALVFLGVSKRRYMVWLIIGGLVIVLIWIGGYFLNRHVRKLKRWAH